MKAVVYTRYGPPEVAKLADIPKPAPKQNEILVRVFASTVNRTDAGFRSAEYFISRFWSGLIRPKHKVLGCEFAGVVEDTGTNVTTFRKGERVFGYNDKSFGGHGEYLAIGENEPVTLMPANCSFETAAAITEGAHYALNIIRAAKVRAGQHVLVYGATGAIGSAAVQLLKHFGAKVTAVCNSKNTGLVKSLGAGLVIDYEKVDFTKLGSRHELILDAVGKSSFGQCSPLLTDQGIYISTELGRNSENVFLALTTRFSSGKKVMFPIPTISREDVNFLKSLVENGEFKPVIDRWYTLDQITEAYKYVESGQKTGNVVLKIAD
jgi:NADPH:quinone reductase-like Zn-dependent oxidoreductase